MPACAILLAWACCTLCLSAVTSTEFTKKSLLTHRGEVVTEGTPLLLAVQSLVFDVSSGAEFYGKGESYEVLSGKDITKAVALTSLEAPDLTDDMTGVSDESMEALEDIFESVYISKYPIVGYVMDSRAAPHGLTPNEFYQATLARLALKKSQRAGEKQELRR